ncbi:MAG TPA: TssQ family T6SS-associated lipoprotein [Usitatibacter sp.]|nr:TssQ family T6SS-associated lipoprotein [Usitatibacter sp.]
MTAVAAMVRIASVAAVLLTAACSLLQKQEEAAPRAPAPQITEESLRERAHEQLALGIRQYEAGEFDSAVKSLTASLDHGLLTKAEQSRARKYLAFSHCVSNREQQCRDEFRKAFEINPEFALTPAEDGHPIWGPVYRSVRTQLIAEREASVPKAAASLGRAEKTLQDGLVKYDAGEYAEAAKLLEAAIKEGLADPRDQVRAMKHVAFTLCLREHFRECRAEFVKIYDVDPNFDLTPAEAGHPSWTKTFAQAKAQAKRAQAAKEKENRSGAGTSKKN